MNDVKWDMVPLGLVAEFHTGWTPPSGDDKYYGGVHKWANISDVGSRDLYETERTISDYALERQAGAKPANPGDLLFPFKLSIGAVSFAREKMYTNEAIAVFPPNEKFNLRFFYYALPYFLLKNAGVNIYGAPLLNATLIKQARVPLPPLESQHRIADYLDRETSEIDAAVADLDRYLELLEKRKKTLAVKHIFPYGFPQNLLSASDYLALGYQSVQRIASFAKLRKKRNDDPNADYLSLLRGRGVIPYEEKGNVGNKKPQDLTTSFMVEKGDYLVNSMNFGIGSFGRSSYSGVASAAYLIFCINEDLVNPDFLQFVFANDDLRAQAQNLGNGILEHRKSINWDRFRAIYVPMPQRGKQDAIVDVLSRETSELQSLIVESTKLRDLLLKRRSVLITEVVTGRKRV